uniref:Growth hormone inducible transmembrane protein n=1 Tax=Haemonchus contortus TaxID=6289 RepID=A0A7I4YGV8_HAECO
EGSGFILSTHYLKMLSRFAIRPSLCISPSVRQFSKTIFNNARMGRGSTGIHRFGESVGIGVRPGKTLKERLLGPTTGAPYIYGSYALAGASVFGVGALMYYGLVSKEQSILQSSALWPAYVRERLSSTYSYLAGSLAVTAASGVAASRNAAIMRLTQTGGILGLFATLAVIIGTGMLCRAIDYDSTVAKHLAWMLHCGAMGAVLAPLVYMGGPVLMRAAWYTAGIVGGLSATAITAPSEKFLMMSGPLAMGLGVVFVANIGTFFFHPGTALGAGLMSIVMYGGLILFSAFLLHDTQRVVKHAQIYPRREDAMMYGMPMTNAIKSYDPINAQLSIYLDVLNIFIRLAMIMGGMSGNRRK